MTTIIIVKHVFYYGITTYADGNTMKDSNPQIVQLSGMPNGGSDLALKRNVRVLENVLDKVLALRPVTWLWKTNPDDKSTQYGFIAQEVEEVMPDLVSEGTWSNGDQVKFLSTSSLVPFTISAIQEQHQTIRGLTTTLKKQQQEIAALKRALEDLKKHIPKA